ncbi:MAG: DinB family protein, partial [Chloroflexi bacterium]|nr:DinB family protein [Chloroflexota bacterium]
MASRKSCSSKHSWISGRAKPASPRNCLRRPDPARRFSSPPAQRERVAGVRCRRDCVGEDRTGPRSFLDAATGVGQSGNTNPKGVGPMSELAQQAKAFADNGRDALLKTLACVPDDKLNWQPAETAKTALQIAAHAALPNSLFAALIRGEGFPRVPAEEVFAQQAAAEAALTTRQQVVQLIERSTVEVGAALDALTPELMASTVETPLLTAPMTFFMTLPGLHMYTHASQIDYLQTIWGD